MAVDARGSLCYACGMTVSELAFSPPRTRGRSAKPIQASYVRDLEEADIALLASERGIKAKPIAKLRDRHHALARCLALGMTDYEASAVTGYDPSRISILKADPTFKGLVDHYRENAGSAVAEFQDRAAQLAISAIAEMQERVEDEEDPLSFGQLLEAAKFAADRTGNAPVTKQLNMNASLDLGNRVAAARRRMEAIPPPPEASDPLAPKVIDAEFTEVPLPSATEEPS